MRLRARLILLYLAFWLAVFECGRVVFLLYQWRHTTELPWSLVAGALLHGLKLDFSIACVLSMIPACLIIRHGFLPHRVIWRLLLGYTVIAGIFVTLTIVADLEMFRVWGYRIDAASLEYLAAPREALASASGSPLLTLVGIWAIATVLVIVASRALLASSLERLPPVGRGSAALLMLCVLTALFIGSQNGFRFRIPLSAGSVYFSRDNYANQSAVNPVWNLLASALNSSEPPVQNYVDPAIAKAIVDSLLKPAAGNRSGVERRLLKDRPRRIVLLLWESLTAKIVAPMGGRSDVTPGFTRLAREGILFDNVYASGSRTSNGLVAVLSGLPANPVVNPLQSAERVAALPSLSVTLSKAGYRTAFYYGAPLEFDDRNRYFLAGHYDEIVEKKDFDPSAWNSAWGVHDPLTLDRLFRAVSSAREPIFAATLTLSSHEPFEVPPPAAIAGRDPEHRFLNAQAYTDRAVSRFVDRLKNNPGWDNTLLIIIADHGSPYPDAGAALASAPEQYRIPMLWLGGALRVRDTVISQLASQFDVPKTLLAQLGIATGEYKWGKDFLAPGARSFAFYAFLNGFGYVDDSGSYVFDNVAQAVIHSAGRPSASAIAAGRAFQQVVMQEYLDLTHPPGVRNVGSSVFPSAGRADQQRESLRAPEAGRF